MNYDDQSSLTKNVFSYNSLSILIIETPIERTGKRKPYQENPISIRIDQVVQSSGLEAGGREGGEREGGGKSAENDI